MATLEDIRRQFPQAAGMSDSEIITKMSEAGGLDPKYVAGRLGVDINPDGFKSGLKRGLAGMVGGVGEIVGDVTGRRNNALTNFAKDVEFRNPSEINSLQDVLDKPGTAAASAVGGALPYLIPGAGLKLGAAGLRAAKAANTARALDNPLTQAAVAGLPSLGEVGDSQREQGVDSPWAKYGGALAVGAVENLGGVQRVLGFGGQQARRTAAQEVAGFGNTPWKTALKTTGRMMGQEGLEEVAQTPIEQVAGYRDPTTAQALEETALGGVMGTLGGVIGAGHGVSQGLRHAQIKRGISTDLLNPDADFGRRLGLGEYEREFRAKDVGRDQADQWYGAFSEGLVQDRDARAASQEDQRRRQVFADNTAQITRAGQAQDLLAGANPDTRLRDFIEQGLWQNQVANNRMDRPAAVDYQRWWESVPDPTNPAAYEQFWQRVAPVVDQQANQYGVTPDMFGAPPSVPVSFAPREEAPTPQVNKRQMALDFDTPTTPPVMYAAPQGVFSQQPIGDPAGTVHRMDPMYGVTPDMFGAPPSVPVSFAPREEPISTPVNKRQVGFDFDAPVTPEALYGNQHGSGAFTQLPVGDGISTMQRLDDEPTVQNIPLPTDVGGAVAVLNMASELQKAGKLGAVMPGTPLHRAIVQARMIISGAGLKAPSAPTTPPGGQAAKPAPKQPAKDKPTPAPKAPKSDKARQFETELNAAVEAGVPGASEVRDEWNKRNKTFADYKELEAKLRDVKQGPDIPVKTAEQSLAEKAGANLEQAPNKARAVLESLIADLAKTHPKGAADLSAFIGYATGDETNQATQAAGRGVSRQAVHTNVKKALNALRGVAETRGVNVEELQALIRSEMEDVDEILAATQTSEVDARDFGGNLTVKNNRKASKKGAAKPSAEVEALAAEQAEDSASEDEDSTRPAYSTHVDPEEAYRAAYARALEKQANEKAAEEAGNAARAKAKRSNTLLAKQDAEGRLEEPETPKPTAEPTYNHSAADYAVAEDSWAYDVEEALRGGLEATPWEDLPQALKDRFTQVVKDATSPTLVRPNYSAISKARTYYDEEYQDGKSRAEARAEPDAGSQSQDQGGIQDAERGGSGQEGTTRGEARAEAAQAEAEHTAEEDLTPEAIEAAWDKAAVPLGLPKFQALTASQRNELLGVATEAEFNDVANDIAADLHAEAVGVEDVDFDSAPDAPTTSAHRIEPTGDRTKVRWDGTRGSAYNKSVSASIRRLTDDDDVTLDYPELDGAVYVYGFETMAGATPGTGQASAVLSELTKWADTNGETMALTAAASGRLKQADLKAWYARNGFTDVGGSVMVRKPTKSTAAHRIEPAAGRRTYVRAMVGLRNNLPKSPTLDAEMRKNLVAGNVKGALDAIANGGSSVAARQLAKKVAALMTGDVRVEVVEPGKYYPEGVPNILASAYGVADIDRDNKRITIYLRSDVGVNEETVLHEALHAALQSRYDFLEYGDAKGKAGEAALAQFKDTWAAFQAEVSRAAGELPIGVREAARSPDEFITYALTNPETQAWMQSRRYRGQTLWERFKNFVASVLGFRSAPSWLDAAMRVSNELLEGAAQDKADFSASDALTGRSAVSPQLIELADRYGPTAAKAVTDTSNILRKAGDSMLFLHDLVDKYKGQLPSAGAWYKAVQGSIARKHQLEQDAEQIATRAAKPGVDMGRVNDFISRSTFEQKWGYDATFDGVNGPKSVKADPAMAAEFKRLSADEQQLIKDVFAHGEKMATTKSKLLKDLGLTDNGFLTMGKLVGPYAPLKRFGNYVSVGKSQQLADLEAKRAEQEKNGAKTTEVDKQIQALKADPAHYIVSYHATPGLAREEAKARATKYAFTDHFEKSTRVDQDRKMPQEVFQKIIAAVKAEPLPGEVKEAMRAMVEQLYVEALDEHNARTSGLKRENRAGYDPDMMKAFLSHARAEANFLANIEFGPQMNEQFFAMQNEAKDEGGKRSAQDAFNEFGKHYAENLTYRETPWQDRAVALTSAWQLATSVGYHVTNATQGLMVTVPKLAADFGDYAGAWRHMMDGYRALATTGVKNLDLSKVGDAGLRDALQRASDMGVLDVGMDEDLTQFNVLRTGYAGVDKASSVARKALHALRQMSRWVETANRVSAATAAYRMAREKGRSVEEAQDYAVKILQSTQGDFSRVGSPLLLKKLPKPMTQYRKYQFMMGALYAKAFSDAFGSADADTKAAGRRMLKYKLAHTAFAAGALGLPLVNLATLVFAATGDDDEPEDLERWLRDTIGDETLADLLLHGVPAMAGVDMHAKLGDDKIFSITPYTEWDLSSRDGFAKTLVGFLGPAAAQGATFADGVGKMQNGDYYKGLEQFMPKGIKDGMAAFRMANEGYTLTNGDVLVGPEDIGGFSLAASALGLPSTEIKKIQWLRGQQYEAKQFFTERTREIQREYARAAEAGDDEAMAELRDDWMALQDGKDKIRPYFNNSPDELRRQALSTLLKYPQKAAERERKLQATVPE